MVDGIYGSRLRSEKRSSSSERLELREESASGDLLEGRMAFPVAS
jgi:hypothetical protein